MKQMIKNVFVLFMLILMTMGMLMNNAFAANDFSKTQLGSKAKYSYGGNEHGTVLYMTKGGEEVYCLEYNKTPANSYSKQDPNFLSQKSKEDLGLINYYVHQDYSGKDAYAITQSLVWRYRAGSVKSFIKVKGIARTQSKGTYENYFKQIMAKINNLRKETSLDGASKTVKAKQTAIFVDNNNIISNYKIISSKGAKASISENKLTVTPDGSVTKVKINLKKIAPKGYQTGICLVWSNGSNKQRIGKLDGQWHPERISVTLNVLPATGDLHITKTDITGQKEVEGAKLKVTDEAGKTVDEWTSTKEVHVIKNLNSGAKYTLTEVSAPEGYKVADSITFTLDKDGKVTKVNMKDEREEINIHTTATDGQTKSHTGVIGKTTIIDKVAYTNLIRGKEYTVKGKLMNQSTGKALLDKNGKEITAEKTFTAEQANGTVDMTFTFDSFHLGYGVKTVVFEDLYEKGVKVATHADINDKGQTVEFKKLLTSIQVNKIDSMTKQLIKSKDFKFGIYSDEACKKLIAEVNADTATGTATFKDVEYGTYYIKETAAPKGYKLSSEVIKVVVDEKLENVGKTYSISYMNTPLPAAAGRVQTGDGTSIFGLIAMLFASVYAIYRLIKVKKATA